MPKEPEKPKRGGARPGAGRRKDNKVLHEPSETKEHVAVRLYPSQKKRIEAQFGSVQELLDKY